MKTKRGDNKMDVKWYQGYFNVHRQLTGYPDRDGNHRSKFRDHQDTEGFRHMDAVLLQSSVIDRRTGCCSFTVVLIGRNMSDGRRSTRQRSVANYRQCPATRWIVVGLVVLSPRKTHNVRRNDWQDKRCRGPLQSPATALSLHETAVAMF